MPHALKTATKALERATEKEQILRICWETNGRMLPNYAKQAAELSLATGGNLKFDLKTWDENLNEMLCGTPSQATLKNFDVHGITGFERLITRTPEEKNKKVGAYKSAWRKKLVQEGHIIVGCVGDQLSDFEGGNTGYRVKIPNYLYATY